jgi:hypothetical protein
MYLLCLRKAALPLDAIRNSLAYFSLALCTMEMVYIGMATQTGQLINNG